MIVLSGCSPTAADEAEILKAALASASADLRTDKLCIRSTLVERQSAEDLNRWAYIAARTPPGFTAVESPARPEGYDYAEKPVPDALANRWRVSDADLCLQATIPTVAGDRALVSFTMEEVRGAFPRTNYWLERTDGEWRVALKNEDHQDI